MKVLECGCEQSETTGTFVSLCFDHGQHMQLHAGAAVHPRNMTAKALPPPAKDPEFERALILALAPVILAKWGTVTDATSSAECLYQHIAEITRRME